MQIEAKLLASGAKLDLRDIVAFLKVAEEGDFSSAARILSVTPSAVSKAVGRLEDYLKHRLFQRTSRTMGLTEEGQNFLDAARRIIDAVEEAEATRAGTPSGRLRIRSTPSFAWYKIAPIIPEFRRRYPQIDIEFTLTNDRPGSLDDGADIAIASGSLASSSLIARKITSSRWIICASPEYLAARGVPKSHDELRDHTCLNFSMHTEWNRWSTGLKPSSSTRRDGLIVANQAEMLLALARAGTGIVRLTEFHLNEDLRTGSMVRLFDQCSAEPEEPIWALFQDRRHLSSRVRVFLEYLSEQFSDSN